MTKVIKKYSYHFTSFKEALLNVYDLSGGNRNYDFNKIVGISDTKALKEDWNDVGNDIRKAIDEYSRNDKC